MEEPGRAYSQPSTAGSGVLTVSRATACVDGRGVSRSSSAPQSHPWARTQGRCLFAWSLLLCKWLPWWLGNKESICHAGNMGSISGWGRSSGEGHGNLLQYLAWRVPWTEEPGRLQGHRESDKTKVTDHTRMRTLLHQLHMHLDKLAFKIKK